MNILRNSAWLLKKFLEGVNMSREFEYNLNNMYAVDAINMLEQMNKKSLTRVVSAIPVERLGDLLKESEGGILNRLLLSISNERLVEIFKFMKVDDITDVIGALGTGRRKRLLNKLDHPYAKVVIELLGYNSKSAGGLMTTEYVCFEEMSTILDVYNKLSEIEPSTEVIDEIYIVDKSKKLTGKISIRSLFVHDNAIVIKDIMKTSIVTVSPYDDREKVALVAAKYDLVNVPVVDNHGRILGVITSDDIINNMYKEQNEEVLNLGGVINNGTIDITISRSLISRLPWLLVNLCTVFLASFIIGQFDREIEKFVGLAMVMPIIAGMGGNSGNQVLAVTIRSIALERLNLRKHWNKVYTEIVIGAINGLLFGAIAGAVIYMKFHSTRFSLIILISMTCNFVLANIVGFFGPLLLKTLKIDPTSGSSIMLTAFTDSMGFLIFLSLSKLMLISL